MTRSWARAVQTNENNSGFFGSSEMGGIASGETLLKAWWNIALVGTWVNPGQYPPGGSICRAGVVYAEAGLAPLSTPTPITNGDADWLTITTLNPRATFTSATDLIYMLHWDVELDKPIASMRKNGGATTMGFYVAWEFSLSDEISGFTVPWWMSSLDTYTNTP